MKPSSWFYCRIKPFSAIPAPTPSPILKHGPLFRNCDFPSLLRRLNSEHGSLVRLEIPFRDPMLLVFCPGLAEEVYRRVGHSPVRTGFYALHQVRSENPFFRGCRGLLISQGEEWREMRRKVQPVFKTAAPYVGQLQSVADDFVTNCITANRDDRGRVKVDLLQELYRFSLECVGVVALNARLNCLDKELEEEPSKLIEAVSVMMKTTAKLDSGIQLWKFFPNSDFRQFRAACETFRAIALKYLTDAVKQNENIGLVERLINGGCDERMALVTGLDMIFGGVDSVAHSTAFALHHLAVNQNAQNKIYQELDDEASSTTYFKSAIKESLRMNPTAIALPRKLQQSIELNGYNVPKNVTVIIGHEAMSNDPNLVLNAEAFLPDRWLRDEKRRRNIHPFICLPFGYGTRMCIGKAFAEAEMRILLTRILREYRVGWTGHETLGMKMQTISIPSIPLTHFTFEKRQ